MEGLEVLIDEGQPIPPDLHPIVLEAIRGWREQNRSPTRTERTQNRTEMYMGMMA
jgi:hypothetical protein